MPVACDQHAVPFAFKSVILSGWSEDRGAPIARMDRKSRQG
ncbi:hypothetical protein CEV34_3509 [Brucella pseudogrignonensis]|uniref:Uncharacterized protein n=1 Tax=Brucella pseudogrignonensis TaxID=419475 RepID=A0A256G8Q3_9HYPH|nr:hypothetical protein CEV34_3509 [Brucella pseudogrignonensis]